MSETLVDVDSVTFSYGSRQVLKGITMQVPKGRVVAIMGGRGCGKTTLLRLIGGQLRPTSGGIRIAGEAVNTLDTAGLYRLRRRMSMLFQFGALFTDLTVFENVAFPLQIRKLHRKEIENRVGDALDLVSLGEFGQRKSPELSGGQQQRVAVARAIVQSPDAMLLDEPLSNLDAKLRDRTRAEIHRLQRSLGIAAMYVTHDQAEALALSDRVLVMRDGRVVQEGTPRQIYEQPANEFVADVVGAANFLDVMSEPVGTGGARVWLPGGATVDVLRGSVGGAVSRLMLRPDRVAIAPANAPDGLPAARISGTVRQRLYQGSHFEYVVAIDAATTLRVFARAEIAEGSAVLLGINGADCVLVESTTDKQGAGKPCR